MSEQFQELMRRLHSFMLQQGNASLGIVLVGEEWSVSLEFGKEAEDSDMVGGASYQVGEQLIPCLQRLVEEVGA